MGRSETGDDGDSERDILAGMVEAGITKTVVHEVTSVERGSGIKSPMNAYSMYGKIDE
jgi:hypothetical protein